MYPIPTVVTICGSMRFHMEQLGAAQDETLRGNIVLMGFVDTHNIAAQEFKPMLDELHLRKIDMSDEILVVNIGGYIGESTRREISYAESRGKPVRYIE